MKKKSVNSLAVLESKEEDATGYFPWCNKDGSFKSDEEIAELGKTWDSNTWEDYLKASVGTIEDLRLCFFPDMDTEFILERSAVLHILKNHKEYDGMEKVLLLALEKLTAKEKAVIECSFWQGMEDKEVAKALEIGHGTVRVHKSCAIKKLRKLLPSKSFRIYLKHLKNNKKRQNNLQSVDFIKKSKDSEDELLKAS